MFYIGGASAPVLSKGGSGMVIAVMTLVLLVDGIDASIVQVALPSMSSEMGMSVTDGAFVVVAYLVPLAGLCVPLSRIAERGRVVAFLRVGVVVFTAASVACAASDDRAMLVLWRFVQGIGAGLMVSGTPSMSTWMLPPERRHMGMAYMNAACCVAIVLGPALGGLITGIWTWHWIFLINVPLGIAILALSFLLPKDTDRGRVRMPEPGRAAAMFVSVASGLVALELLTDGSYLVYAAAAGVVCLVSMAAYCLLGDVTLPASERLSAPPMRGHRRYYALTMVFVVNTVIGCGVSYLLPYYLTGTAEYSTLATGMLMAAATTVSAIVSIPTGTWCRRSGCRIPVSFSLALRVVFCLMLVFIEPSLGLAYLLMQLVVMGASFGISGTAQPTRMLENVDEGDRASAASAVVFTNYIATALGVALFALMFKLASPDGLASDIGVMDGASIMGGMHAACAVGAVLSVLCLAVSLKIRDDRSR